MSSTLPATDRPVLRPGHIQRSDKIHAWHHDRLAVVYVRQSSPQQVQRHQESTRLQYGLTERAAALGWATDRIVVIDDDQGESGRYTESRLGFQRLVSEVSLDHVGLILGIEMSRLARSNKDWHQLLELCALFRTLIADLDGVYDPAQYNDRLLLGLKGTMSEAELHILKQRMYEGRLSKARRGELSFPLPTGYVWRDGEIALDPDDQVQAVVRLIFTKFAELHTLHGVLRYLADNGIQLGVRVREGPGKGELVWRRPNRMTLQQILKHPLYAGTYVYGRRLVDPRRQLPGKPRTGRVVAARPDWLAVLPARCPAYLSQAQFEANLAQLQENRARVSSKGAVRNGAALLAGLVVCGRCHARMLVRYGDRVGGHSYVCQRPASNYGGPACQQLGGRLLDGHVVAQVLVALEPAGLSLSLEAAAYVEAERASLERLWQQRRERAAYEAERAARQYHAVDPEHRLVARTLERAWEEKLVAQQELDEQYHRFAREQPRLLTAAERAAIQQLAADIPALWAAATTTVADRKEILRQVIEQVQVAAQGTSEQVTVTIVWAGGEPTTTALIRPLARTDRLSTYPMLGVRVRALAAEGRTASAIAHCLDAEGFRPAKGTHFTAQQVLVLRQQLGIPASSPHQPRGDALEPDEWWPRDLARVLGASKSSLAYWIRHGWVRARRQEQPPRWIVWADGTELERLRTLRAQPLDRQIRRRWLARPATEGLATGAPAVQPSSQ
jgi:DNA invertase Pin-like site-specific DNA recombinase